MSESFDLQSAIITSKNIRKFNHRRAICRGVSRVDVGYGDDRLSELLLANHACELVDKVISPKFPSQHFPSRDRLLNFISQSPIAHRRDIVVSQSKIKIKKQREKKE